MNCGDCEFCCKNTLVFILPDDDYKYETRSSKDLILEQKPNGDCIYLDNGCSIYKHRPMMCKFYSCIDFYNIAVKNGYHHITNNKEFEAVAKAAIKRNQK